VTDAPQRTRGRSLERELPLLLIGVLTVIVAAFLALTYRALERSAETSIREGLTTAASQVASSIVPTITDRVTRLGRAASDPAIRAALRTDAASPVDLEAARRALESLRLPAESTLAVELRDATGRKIAYLGPDLGDASLGTLASDSIVFGPMYGTGDRVHYWAVGPVVENGRRIGHIAQQRRVGGPANAEQQLRDLTGEDVRMFLRNTDGKFWSASQGIPVAAPNRRDTIERGIFDDWPQRGRSIAVEAPIAGTPWLVVLETPLDAALARARGTLMTLALSSLLLMGIGAAISWIISRRITKPLASLTTAAEAIARGDRARHVHYGSADEIGRLATSFNEMARQVDASRRELEAQVKEAQTVAGELARANQQLQLAMLEADDSRREAERAREEADRANRAKGDFLAVMSHELRTPLNAIAGYAQLLEMEISGPVTPAQRDALSRIARNQTHLSRLINDVLHFAKIDAGQIVYSIADVGVDEALDGLEALIAPQLRARGLRFKYRQCDPRTSVRADREKLEQIVLNLLSNAIKFTPEGGSIDVWCDAAGALPVKICVRDTGVGIPPERLRSIFEPFVQGERSPQAPNDGVGLGLAISRELARGMGGDLTVESTVGRGSVFTLSLPAGATTIADSESSRGPELERATPGSIDA
jgi:signal transduction histidine kinase